MYIFIQELILYISKCQTIFVQGIYFSFIQCPSQFSKIGDYIGFWNKTRGISICLACRASVHITLLIPLSLPIPIFFYNSATFPKTSLFSSFDLFFFSYFKLEKGTLKMSFSLKFSCFTYPLLISNLFILNIPIKRQMTLELTSAYYVLHL